MSSRTFLPTLNRQRRDIIRSLRSALEVIEKLEAQPDVSTQDIVQMDNAIGFAQQATRDLNQARGFLFYHYYYGDV